MGGQPRGGQAAEAAVQTEPPRSRTRSGPARPQSPHAARQPPAPHRGRHGMNFGDFMEGLGGGFVVNEAFAWSGRLAHKIIPAAARLWTCEPERREVYREEWSRVVEDCPGNLWRLAVAMKFMGGG